MEDDRHSRIAIIGSGFAGLGAAIRLKQEGFHDFVVLERAEDVGGTWRDNTYPGIACDVPSHLYSFSFAQNPDWTRTYSPGHEIWHYLRDCSERFGVTPHIRFGHDVQGARWDEGSRRWELETSRGTQTAEIVIAGMGPLSEPSFPDIDGIESFEGRLFHSAQWDHDYDLSGKRVAVIGTGASSIQIVPKIQPKVAELRLFQRTAPWILPHTDRPVTRVERRLYRLFPPLQRLVRAGIYWSRESLVPGFVMDQRFMRIPEFLGRRHLARQVRDPELRRKLRPQFRIGCKRILISNGYYPALTQPNVEVVTEAISEFRPSGIVTADGTLHELDAVILGTGFHVTDMPAAQRVRGRDGLLLDDVWKGSPQAYLGTTIAGFPNMFMLIGPNTGLGHNSMVFMIESQLTYLLDCLRKMDEQGIATVDVRPEAQERFNQRIQERMRGTVWNSGCASWYIDHNGRNTTLWPGFTWKYRQLTREFDPEEYHLETGRPAPLPAAA